MTIVRSLYAGLVSEFRDPARSGLRLRKLGRAMADPRLGLLALRWGVFPSLDHDGLDMTPYRTLIDVGANRGQFAVWALTSSPGLEVVAIEPGGDAFNVLRCVLKRFPGRVTTLNAAVSSTAGSALLHVARGNDNSSLMMPSTVQVGLAPESSIVGSEVVKVIRLDEVLRDDLARPMFVKIDVQGSELKVLESMGQRLASVDAVYVELSLCRLYEGGALADDVCQCLAANNFVLSELRNPTTVRRNVVQCDALFVRRSRSVVGVPSVPGGGSF